MGEQDQDKVMLRHDVFSVALHNGSVTITSPRSGKRQTFQITTVLAGGMMGERLVKVLIGPDPQAFQSWATFGLVKFGKAQLWKRWDTKTYQGYARALERPADYLARGYVYIA